MGVVAVGYLVVHLTILLFGFRHHDTFLVVTSLLNAVAALGCWFSIAVVLRRSVARWDEAHQLMFRTRIPPI